jgi:CHAT domain-containing protein/tetratricopeptide (TPR) repeat protein
MLAMSRARGMARWLPIALCAFLVAFAPAAHAQEPSKELKALRETSQALWRVGDYASALQFAEKALPLVVREYGAEHEQAAIQYYSLALINQALGDLAQAERHFTETVRIREKVYGTDSVSVAIALENLGQVQLKRGHPESAEPLFRRALKIKQDTVGPQHAFSASGHANLGDIGLARGKWAEARASYREAIRLLAGQDTSYAIVKKLVEKEIKDFRDTFVGLCRSVWQLRAEPGANRADMIEETFRSAQLAWQTSAAAALAKMTARLGTSNTDLGRRIRRLQDTTERVLTLHDEDQKLLTQWYAVQTANPAYSAALAEFRASSIARSRDQAPTVKRQTELVRQLTALLERCPPGQRKTGCDAADRERSNISKELSELNQVTAKGSGEIMAIHARMEAAERALPGYAQFTSRRTALRDDIDRAEQDGREARAQIGRAFPGYADLVEPKPLSVAAVQALLKADEALVAILVGTSRSYVWALTRERAEWAEIEAGTAALSEHVDLLRKGLDPLAQLDAEGAPGSKPGVVQGFDLGRAHSLYKLVLGPVAAALAGKRHLIVVPTGPLTSVPFQVLITAPPGTQTGAAALRDAAWLIKSYALSVLPSVQSLQALRRLAPSGVAARPFFGVGDPVLEGPGGPVNPKQRNARRSSAAPARFYRSNGLADIRAVRELAPLPDTAEEVRTIGKVLGASPDAIYLREAATETRVRAAALSEYRVIHFATHGLVAGDLSGLAEPALVLTPPPVATEADDGLLTASEIAGLTLNADWVVLSACNTAAGSTEGAEALSGLARAFFYAGARALLVSHWAVYSQAATELTTKTFAALGTNPKLGRAEAFRGAMLQLIARGEPPSYWAPFVIVGEAGSVER